ncbi:MAG: amino acid racemase [Gammaproteobacteria bacterium]|nr:amino acid racemase [Gammaproteobacteria bacterium]
MNHIGLIGGVSWASTMEYYKRLNEFSHRVNGGHSSAKLSIISLNFDDILSAQKSNDFNLEFKILRSAAFDLKRTGVESIAICSNTTSSLCDELQFEVGLPFINIIDATALAIMNLNIRTAGLLGTRFVMEREFYKHRFLDLGITIKVPKSTIRDDIHSAIYNDLCHYRLTETARTSIYRGMDDLVDQGVDAIILGCTEIPLIVKEKGFYRDKPVIDSIDAHLWAILNSTKHKTLTEKALT